MLKPIVTAAEMREIEKRTARELGIPESQMIDLAGLRVYQSVEAYYTSRGIGREVPCFFICGKGHNGADGLRAALCAIDNNMVARVFQIHSEKGYSEETRSLHEEYRKRGINIDLVRRISDLKIDGGAALIVDGLLGTGLTRPAADLIKDCIACINRRKLPVLSIDIPSGLFTDSNEIHESVVAWKTLSLGSLKLSSFFQPARARFGKVEYDPLCFDNDGLSAMPSAIKCFLKEDAVHCLPRREWDAHKYSAGKVLVVAGSQGMHGAAALAAQAAMRVGAGMVRLAVPAGLRQEVGQRVLEPILIPVGDPQRDFNFTAGHVKELRSHVEWADAVVVGPGLGKSPETLTFLKQFIPGVSKPTIVDGDGLRYFSEGDQSKSTSNPEGRNILLTPHDGEFSRIIQKTVPRDPWERMNALRSAASRGGISIILKGPTSLYADLSGSLCVLEPGSPALATAGTGDVLSGVLGGLLCHLSVEEAAGLGVYLHSRAGQLAAEAKSVLGTTARDVLEAIPLSILEIE